MAYKSKTTKPILTQYSLPSDNDDLRRFIDSKKADMMEQAVSSIAYAIDNKLSFVEIFQFKNSDFVVMLSDNDFLPNLEHIYDYYIENEMYEFCGRVIGLKKRLSNKIKLNET